MLTVILPHNTGNGRALIFDVGLLDMDEIFEGPIKFILRVIRWLFVELLCDFVFFQVGRLFLLVITLGKYPSSHQLAQHEGRITLTGFFVTVAIVGVISVVLNDTGL